MTERRRYEPHLFLHTVRVATSAWVGALVWSVSSSWSLLGAGYVPMEGTGSSTAAVLPLGEVTSSNGRWCSGRGVGKLVPSR